MNIETSRSTGVSPAKILIDTMADHEIAPCLADGPLSQSGTSFIESARSIGDHPYASVLRAWCVPALFTAMERLLDEGADPIAGINVTLLDLSTFITNAGKAGFDRIGVVGKDDEAENVFPGNDVKGVTGDHYGNLFKEFSSRSYWDEPVQLLEQRLTRNGIRVTDIAGRSVLDAGCGGGRYSAAWRLLGAAPVAGVDVSPINIGDAARRAALANLDDLSFKQGDVLNLPYADSKFDIVFSNGVLHHTTDWEHGVSELVRVLKPGGWGWLYLIENPGGVFWDVIEILRVLMKGENRAAARSALHALNMPANRIFYMLDHVMVPINVRLSPEEIERCLAASGAVGIRRLDRGADIDRVEHIHLKRRYAAEHFGVGENRYIFTKP